MRFSSAAVKKGLIIGVLVILPLLLSAQEVLSPEQEIDYDWEADSREP